MTEPKTAEEIIRQTLGLETALQAAEVYNEVLKAMEAFHSQFKPTDEWINEHSEYYRKFGIEAAAGAMTAMQKMRDKIFKNP